MSKQSIREDLAGHDFFSDLDAETLDFLASHASERELSEDEVVHRYDSPAEDFFLVREGRITVEVAAIEGPPLELQNLGEGAILGWSWLIPPYRWSFQARAETPGKVLQFDGKAIRERCESDPAFGYEILKRFSRLMSERLQFAREKMMEEWNPPGFA